VTVFAEGLRADIRAAWDLLSADETLRRNAHASGAQNLNTTNEARTDGKGGRRRPQSAGVLGVGTAVAFSENSMKLRNGSCLCLLFLLRVRADLSKRVRNDRAELCECRNAYSPRQRTTSRPRSYT
jgi:hypothetical protein